MDINRYGFGLNIDCAKLPIGVEVAEAMLYQIFSLGKASDFCDVFIFGGECEKMKDSYIIVMDNMSFSQAKKLRIKIENDAMCNLFLDSETPFLGKNKIKNDTGLLSPIGSVTNGEFVSSDRSKTIRLNKHSFLKYHFVLAPDKYKGSLSSLDAIRIFAISARRHFLGAKLLPLPVADGGEGSIDAFMTALGGEYVAIAATDPLGREVEAKYLILSSQTAVIETAQASGLGLIEESERDVLMASSYGTGEIIKKALESGCKNIIVSLGGSATNDGGMGLARALGVRFYDISDNLLMGSGADLLKVKRIDLNHIEPLAKEANFTALCDVMNPLLGLDGAAMTFSAQKGADAKTMFELECGMKNFRRMLYEATGIDVATVKGAGAAGGIGAMLYSVFNAELKSGIDTLLEQVGFSKILENTSLVITGEGRLDSQTIKGNKTVNGISAWCEDRAVPLAVIAGSVEQGIELDASIIPIMHSGISLAYSIQNASVLLMEACDRLFKLLSVSKRMRYYESDFVRFAKRAWNIIKKASLYAWKYIKVFAIFLWKWIKVGATMLLRQLKRFAHFVCVKLKKLLDSLAEKLKE